MRPGLVAYYRAWRTGDEAGARRMEQNHLRPHNLIRADRSNIRNCRNDTLGCSEISTGQLRSCPGTGGGVPTKDRHLVIVKAASGLV